MKEIGLIGLDSNGMLYKPNGSKLFKLPFKIACKIQKFQHWIARKTWN